MLGAGRMGKRHAEIIALNNEAELVALIDCRLKEELEIEEYNVPFFSSLNDFLQSGLECDVVNIATPNGLHAQQAITALNGFKHVVIEKPLALKASDAAEVITRSGEVRRQVFPVMQNRYSPPSQWLKEIVRKGLLGKIYMVQLNCYWNRDHRYYTQNTWHGTKNMDGGTLFTQFSHFIDILYWLFGDFENIKSRITNVNHPNLKEFDDNGTVSFDFTRGGMGSIHFSTAVWDRNFESSLTIIAEKGTVKVAGQYMDKVAYCHIKDYQMPTLVKTNPANDYGSFRGSAANHQYVIANVIDVLKGRSAITTEPSEGMKVVEIIEKMYNNS